MNSDGEYYYTRARPGPTRVLLDQFLRDVDGGDDGVSGLERLGAMMRRKSFPLELEQLQQQLAS
jgi:hypothetical protein